VGVELDRPRFLFRPHLLRQNVQVARPLANTRSESPRAKSSRISTTPAAGGFDKGAMRVEVCAWLRTQRSPHRVLDVGDRKIPLE
jgi:hypothetical protein